jgi:dolichol kinase
MDSVTQFAPLPVNLSGDLVPPPAGAAAPSSPAGLTRGELFRKAYHIQAGFLAFAMSVMSINSTIVVMSILLLWNTFIWRILPAKYMTIWRPTERTKGMPSGILIYCLSVLALLGIFYNHKWMAAMVWGVLAFGDGMATVVGRAAGGARLPWNANKGWYGSLTFVFFGTLTAALIARSYHGSFLTVLPLAAALATICAIVESLPLSLDDNLTVPLVGAIALPLLAMVPALAI